MDPEMKDALENSGFVSGKSANTFEEGRPMGRSISPSIFYSQVWQGSVHAAGPRQDSQAQGEAGAQEVPDHVGSEGFPSPTTWTSDSGGRG